MILLLSILLATSIIANIVLLISYSKSRKIKQGATTEIELFLSSIEGEVNRFRKKYIKEKKT